MIASRLSTPEAGTVRLSGMGVANRHAVNYTLLPLPWLNLLTTTPCTDDEDMRPSTNLNWVATMWTIGSAIDSLLVGRPSDTFGRKWMAMGKSLLGFWDASLRHGQNQ